MINQHPNHDSHETPADLRKVIQRVDALGASERASARAGFESHIHSSTVDLINPERLKLVPAPFVKSSARRWISPMRVAAAVAFLSTVGITYLAINGQLKSQSPTIAAIDIDPVADIEHWLTVASSEDTANAVDAEIDLLLADTQKLSEGIRTAPIDGGAL